MAAAKVLDIWMRDCCAGFWGTVRRSGVTLPLFEIITSLLLGREKKHNKYTLTHTHALFSPGAWRSYGEDVARWATEMASVQHFGSEPRWPAAKERERYRGKRGRERWREGGERERAVSINMHQSDGSMRYLTMQANPPSGQPRRGGVLVVGGLVSDHEWVSEFQHPPQTTPTLPPSKPAESSKC